MSMSTASKVRTERGPAIERRTFLKYVVAGGSLALVGGMYRFGAPSAYAQRIGSIPSVDRLVLTSVVDNAYDAVLTGRQMGTVAVQRTVTPNLGLAAEHGLAYQLESFRGDERRLVLLDFGLTSRSLLNNYRLLNIDPSQADALILSHGHADHYGGFLDLADATPQWGARGMTLYAGGEDTFCRRWTVTPDGQPSTAGISGLQLDRADIEARGLQVMLVKEPVVIADHALTSGQIARVTDYETGLANARLEVGPVGADCGDVSHFLPTAVESQPGDLVRDVFQGEIATVYNVMDRGLVVISSCGHAGIINTVRHVQQVTGITKVHAVVGGWHLAASPYDVVNKTVDTFKQIDADYFVPMHCTGFITSALIEAKMPHRLVEPSSGTRVVFGA
jgi:7,8-dihydropterin-6-yl-methyl-4-(beta-D-ribofuranosyl)aminobenzene 5'-phosphate synthase